jgi:hypothetical protein
MSEYERLVAVGGYFDGKLMPPTVVGLDTLRMPICESLSASSVIADVPTTTELRCEDYVRAELNTQDKVFSLWMAKGLTYADVIQRLLDRYCYESE